MLAPFSNTQASHPLLIKSNFHVVCEDYAETVICYAVYLLVLLIIVMVCYAGVASPTCLSITPTISAVASRQLSLALELSDCVVF